MSQAKVSGIEKETAGFTIVELLVAITVLALLAAAVTPVFKQGNDYWQIIQSRTELRQSLNSALQLMAEELRQAKPGTIEVSEALPETANGDETVVTYDTNKSSASNHRSFSLTRSKLRHLNFNYGGKSVPITPTAAIDIIDVTVTEQAGQGEAPLYQIIIQGEYRLPNAVRADERRLTVQTVVAPRAESEAGSEAER